MRTILFVLATLATGCLTETGSDIETTGTTDAPARLEGVPQIEACHSVAGDDDGGVSRIQS